MRIPTVLAIAVAEIFGSLCSQHLVADERHSSPSPREESAVSVREQETASKEPRRMNLALKTAGGTQLWTDHLHRNGYRIQRNAVTGHWRLLDPGNVRRTWGTKEHCQSFLNHLQSDLPADESPRSVVVLIHGLLRSHRSMKSLESDLLEQEDAEAIRFSYASTRSSIGGHAVALREVLEGFPASTQFSFVGHSMGNIVVRHVIGDLQRDGDPEGVLERCRSMVMLGPPNQGAAIARRLAPTGVFGMITGKSGIELGKRWPELVENLAIPPFPFAIIAGDLNRIQNPLVDGASDFLVSVEEARLDGSASFERVAVLHSRLMSDEAVRKRTVEFIRSH
jgi:pimeloyl-ACP methyl ester carboxylesterase